jgi:microcystin-dependent protein
MGPRDERIRGDLREPVAYGDPGESAMSPDVIAPPRKVRVRTSEGWVDLATQGPEGPGYETSPIGSVIAWTRRELPHGYVLADGATYTRAAEPQAYEVAGEEVAAGNPLWTINGAQETFTVPDLRDRFMYASSSAALGARGGASSVALSANQSGVNGNGASGWADRDHSHGLWLRTYDDGAHAHWVNGTWSHPSGGSYTPRYTDRSGGAYEGGWVVGMHDYYNIWNSNVTDGTPAHSHHIGGDTGGFSTNHLHGLQARNADEAHENMPPYVVLAYVVKIRGATISDAGLVGPPGQPGNSITIPIEPWRIVGAAGEPGFESGFRNYGATWGGAGFRKWPDGKVTLSGLVAGGAADSVVFTLPAGYRPPGDLIFAVDTNQNSHARLDVFANGQVLARNPSPAYISLNGVEFDTNTVSEWATGPRGLAGPPGGAPTVQRAIGKSATYATYTALAELDDGAGGLMRITVTPEVASWWEVNAHIGLVMKNDAAYHYAYWRCELDPPDQDGLPGSYVIKTQHSQVQTYEHYSWSRIFRLAAGTAYTARLLIQPNGGSWNVYRDAERLAIEGKLWAQ